MNTKKILLVASLLLLILMLAVACVDQGTTPDGETVGSTDSTTVAETPDGTDPDSDPESETSAEPETAIQCDAVNCSYNKEYKCMAPSVDISGSAASTSRETRCSTFDCKKTL